MEGKLLLRPLLAVLSLSRQPLQKSILLLGIQAAADQRKDPSQRLCWRPILEVVNYLTPHQQLSEQLLLDRLPSQQLLPEPMLLEELLAGLPRRHLRFSPWSSIPRGRN